MYAPDGDLVIDGALIVGKSENSGPAKDYEEKMVKGVITPR